MPVVTPERWDFRLAERVCTNCNQTFGQHIGTSCMRAGFREFRFQYETNREDTMPTTTDYIHWCDGCGEAIDTATDDYHYCGDCELYRCENCGECDGESNHYYDDHYDDDHDDGYGNDRRIRSWDWRPPRWRPKGNYPAEALLGLELEVGGSARSIADVVRAFDDSENHLYMKHDGSISGVEIVTHPATLNWSRNFDWDQLLRNLRMTGSRVDDGYGLHIHVSRNAFRRVGQKSTPHQMAWLMFMYRHAGELSKLARRTSTQWASFKTPERGELKRKSNDSPDRGDRYVAVNCQNDKTYELRFFKSTLESEELFAALEFADASVEYTRGIKTADVLRGKALTWSHFTTWLGKKDYPNLVAQINTHAITQLPKQPPPHRVMPPMGPLMSLDEAIEQAGSRGIIAREGTEYEVLRSGGSWYLRFAHDQWADWRYADYFTSTRWSVVSSTRNNEGPF